MKLLIDLFACQTKSGNRGVGHFTHSLVREMIGLRNSNAMILLANSMYEDKFEELRSEFSRLLPQGSFLPYSHPAITTRLLEGDPYFEISSTLIRHAYQMLSPDVIIYPNIFEGLGEKGVVALPKSKFPAAVCAAIIYDFLPYRFPKIFLDPDPSFKKSYLRRLESYKEFDLLLAVSESTRQEAIEILQIDPGKIINISGANDAIFQAQDFLQAQRETFFSHFNILKPFIFCPTNGEPHENLTGFLQAYALLPQEIRTTMQVVFTNIGNEKEFRENLRGLNICDDEVVVAGHISDHDQALLCNLCHLFVSPSLYEGFGGSILEAMACGAPVIASNRAVAPELLGRPDALFNPSNTESILEIMTRALADDAFRQSLSVNGKERIQLFSWQKSAQKVWDALEAALVSRQKPNRLLSFQVEEKPKVAFVSPMPPQKSGISDYSADLLPYLQKELDIDLFIEPGLETDKGGQLSNIRQIPWTELLKRRDKYDTVIYQMGNSEDHAHMFKLIKEFPGVVVMHDFFLGHLVRYLVDTNHPDFVGNELSGLLDLNHGLRSLIDLSRNGRENIIWEWPLNWQILKFAQEIIVHSPYQNELLKRYFGNGWMPQFNVVKQIHQNLGDNVRKHDEKAKDYLGIGQDKFLFCSFGFINQLKSAQLILRAFHNSFSGSDQVVLVFVGQLEAGEYGCELLSLIHELGLEDCVKITGYVDRNTYEQYLLSANAAIQLRSAARGETSRAVLDVLAHGIPTIVNSLGSLNDYDSNMVVKVPDFPDVESVSSAMLELWKNPDLCEKIGHNAINEIIAQNNPETISHDYMSIIHRAIHQDERLLFKPLIDSIFTHKFSQREIGELASYAADNQKLRCQPRILIDVTNIAFSDLQTGIQRVVNNIISELFVISDPSIHIELVKIVNGKMVRAMKFAKKLFQLPGDDMDVETYVEVLPGDIIYMLDTSWNLFDQYIPVFDSIRKNGGQIFTEIYDLIPIRYPETASADTLAFFEKWVKTAIDQSDVIICISKSVADDLVSYIEEEEIKVNHPLDISYVHLGSDLKIASYCVDKVQDQLKQMIKDDVNPLFLMVGTIEPRKGYSFALDAFEQLWQQGENYRLCIIGNIGWNVKQIEDRIKNHPELNKRLFFFEGATDAELDLSYAYSTALISCSLAEGFGLPIIEAANHNIPAIVSDIPIFHEIGGAGSLFFSLESPKNLAVAIRSIIKLTPEERLILAKKIKILSWKESASMTLEALHNNMVYKSITPTVDKSWRT